MIFQFSYEGDDVVADIREKYGYDGDLLDIFASTEDYMVHKWHHYIPLYDRYFAKYRGTKVKFLEIGVSKGGSLQMWRRYLGDDAVLFGIDIDGSCARFNGLSGQVRIGSQDDPAFLRSVVEEMGGVDVVLDDGSHMMRHVRATLEALFPMLSDRGIYMIEDLHTAYWPEYEGGFRRRRNFFNAVRQIIDDMHERYHGKGKYFPGFGGLVTGMHVHDSIVVLEKGDDIAPTHSQVGQDRI